MTTDASAADPARTSDQPAAPLSHGQIVTILTGLMLGMFLAALDQTIVAPAIRNIADALQRLATAGTPVVVPNGVPILSPVVSLKEPSK